MSKIKPLSFNPAFGLSSKHAQMIVSAFLPIGHEPPSEEFVVDLEHGDKLSCQISTSPTWKNPGRIIVLVHGLGGSHASRYMVRMARKLYQRDDKVIRVNLRGCGSGIHLSKRPYSAENSPDIHKVICKLKEMHPQSDIIVIGYSLGGSIILKLAGELEHKAEGLIKKMIAVCPPLNLEESVRAIEERKNKLYHNYYLKNVLKQAATWVSSEISTLYEFDDKITAPLWGFNNASEYYRNCSCYAILQKINCESHLIFAKDDPFISSQLLDNMIHLSHVHPWLTQYGGHMGFVGSLTSRMQWLDHVLLDWTL